MKILFVVHELSYADHIAIAHLSAMAKQLNHSVFFCNLDTDSLTDKAAEVRPDVIAYSVNIKGSGKAIQSHKEVKRIHKFISIMGGPHPTFSPETFQESDMDAYCVGEGEYPFRDFLIRVEKGASFDDVENLITRNRVNPVRPLIRNLDELPKADRDLVLSNSFLKNTPKKTFYATRGCPFNCAYCCNNYYHELYRGKGATVRRFSVNRIIEEIEEVANKYRMDFVKFGDDCFVLRADDWLEEFAEQYSTKIGVPFNCYLRLDAADDDMLRLLKRAGCFSVHLSVDSTSRHVRETILRRRMRSENIVENLTRIRDHGINTWVNYMLAVPESTLQDDLDTIEMSRRGRVTYPSYTTTIPKKGTDLYNYCVDQELIDPHTYVGDMSGYGERSSLACFPDKEKDVRYNIYLLGAIIAKLPEPLRKVALRLIKVVPPNRLFETMRRVFYEYHISHTIFILPKGE